MSSKMTVAIWLRESSLEYTTMVLSLSYVTLFSNSLYGMFIAFGICPLLYSLSVLTSIITVSSFF